MKYLHVPNSKMFKICKCLLLFVELFTCCLHIARCLRDNEKTRRRYPPEKLPIKFISAYPLVPDYSEYYYYPSIRHKMAEAMSVNNCTMSGLVLFKYPSFGG